MGPAKLDDRELGYIDFLSFLPSLSFFGLLSSFFFLSSFFLGHLGSILGQPCSILPCIALNCMALHTCIHYIALRYITLHYITKSPPSFKVSPKPPKVFPKSPESLPKASQSLPEQEDITQLTKNLIRKSILSVFYILNLAASCRQNLIYKNEILNS